jgi:hypothetical protein
MAGLEIELELDEAKLRELTKLLEAVPRGVPRALTSAINKTLSRLRTIEARAVRDELNLPYGEILQRIALRKATSTTLAGSVRTSRKAVPLIKYGAKQTAAGVSVRCRRSKGPETIHGAFIATMPSGHVGVFKRAPDATHRKVINVKTGRRVSESLKINEQYGPTVVGVLAHKPGMIDVLRGQGEEILEKNIDSAAKWLLSKSAE